MTTRIAFIRGINVGGKSVVPMAALRQELEAAGFKNVRTYIQSGNVVYDPPTGAKDAAAALRAEAGDIARAIDGISGFQPAVMVFPANIVAEHLAASPYSKADQAKAFIVFVDGKPGELRGVEADTAAGEEMQTIGGVIHLHCPNGVGRSKLWAKLAGSTKVRTTTRNLRTIAKVLELAGG